MTYQSRIAHYLLLDKSYAVPVIRKEELNLYTNEVDNNLLISQA